MTKLFASLAFSMTVAACSTNSTTRTSSGALALQVFVSSEASNDVTSTLILGQKDAVLIDAQFITSDAQKLVAMIQASGRHLSAVYITHAHPDHHFGLAALRAAFPDIRILAHPSVAAEMKSTWQAKHDYWKTIYGTDLTDTQVDATAYDLPTLDLEGHPLRLLGPAEGDIANEVCVFVPDLGALITGDTSYNGTHVWLADTKPPQWDAWTANLKTLQALGAKTVVSGHRDSSRPDDPANLGATIQYIDDFKAAVSAGHSGDDVVRVMTSKYPSLKLPIILQLSAKAAFGG